MARQYITSILLLGGWLTGLPVSAATIGIGQLAPGDLQITEYLANPAGIADTTGEYFEIFNARSDDVDLDGLVVRDQGSNQFSVTGLVVPARSFAVLSNGDGNALGFTADFIYGNAMSLTNTADEILLESPDSGILFSLAWQDGDLFGVGVAHELRQLLSGRATAMGAGLGDDFIAATGILPQGNLGSPGAAGNTVLTAQVVPVPAAAWLFGSALGLLLGQRRSGQRRGTLDCIQARQRRNAHAPAPPVTAPFHA